MRKSLSLGLVVGLLAMAFAAMPSLASAFTTTPVLDPPGGTFPAAFTSTSGAGSLIAPGQPEVKCTADTNSGKFESSMTGTAIITFTGCKVKIGILTLNCNTNGDAAGTIKTQELLFHLVYLKPKVATNPHETPGILFTPNAITGVFVEFECTGAAKFVVKGSGVLGDITSPAINVASATATITVDATEAGGQEAKETVEGTKFGLEVSENGGAFGPAFENAGTDTITFTGGKATLTTE